MNEARHPFPTNAGSRAGDQEGQERSGDRSSVFLSATLEHGGIEVSVRMRNVSRSGALLEGASLPAKDEAVVIKRGQRNIPASVRWSNGAVAGIAFDQGLEDGDMLIGPRPATPAMPNNVLAPPLRGGVEYRQGRPGFRTAQMSEVERKWAAQIDPHAGRFGRLGE